MDMDYAAIFKEATDAANKAIEDYRAKYGEPFYCGFAWVTVRPARGPFVTWCKKQIKATEGRREQRAFGDRACDGGWQFWAPGEYNGQSMDLKEAGAVAFAKVLRNYGLDASVGTRAD
jgi:hypothetical protein